MASCPSISETAMPQVNPEIDHLLRRAGFGVSAHDVDIYKDMSPAAAVDYLVDYEGRPDDVDERIGRPDHVLVPTKDLFSPDIDIEDARLRWMFRMIHTRRPLQEKMSLFWHNHFATAYSKLNADSGNIQGAKLLAHKAGTLNGPQGQIELFRQYALGNFRNLLFQVAVDPAMLIWLDGKTNTKAKPQENFGREIMELFTIGVGFYTEPDVYAAARVGQLSAGRIRRYECLSGVRLQRRPARDQRQDLLLPDLLQRQHDHSGAERIRRHAGRDGLDQRARDPSGNRPSAGTQVLEFL